MSDPLNTVSRDPSLVGNVPSRLVHNRGAPPAIGSQSSMPVTAEVIERNKRAFVNADVIVLQHIKHDTEVFLLNLEAVGARIVHIVAKPNSVDPEVLHRVQARYPNRVTLEEYERLETSSKLAEILDAAIEGAARAQRRLAVVDVGGYFAAPLRALQAKFAWSLSGVVEVTTFGHNRYADLIGQIEFPVFSVAKSQIKELEASFVGHAVATSMERVLRSRGLVMQGKRVVVNGFGMIGRNVANALRSRGMIVAVHDKRASRMVQANVVDGFSIGARQTVFPGAEFVVSATAQVNAISEADFDLLPNNAYLMSAGSRTNEFDVQLLLALADSEHLVCPDVQAVCYKGKTLNLVKGGRSVNFLVGSCQEEVMDLLFAEIATCLVRLLTNPPRLLGRLHRSEDGDIDGISSIWLRAFRGFEH
jgi:adenosylhomocysteinase